jgi:hypothetical protein
MFAIMTLTLIISIAKRIIAEVSLIVFALILLI